MYGGGKSYVLMRKLMKRDHLEDLSVDGSIILK